jgi:hypothetical protein
VLGEPATEGGVYLLGLLRRGGQARANRPHGFVGNDNLKGEGGGG